ncbi:PREDICTED: SNF1-related protein kinase regulatory subunit gamma-like PV42a isoform X1 [Camelina sativa]|uniref:SNF1-related protein kinase regulatory subunit gamma-like PV42a isoform X1 n=1 Tax=Camelina sativa TaxID=90675 RepID=A0ABM0VP11_CAMSA|nr:PREDICTED: SNF1-related protein kinase regulatory subunit gamma-like PV42a isoform X1 [Camelina sativa]
MQQEKSEEDHHSRLINVTAKDLTAGNRRLVEVPYTATISHAMNTLVANSISALPVAAPPGHWIGAGGSMIMESDKQTGVVRKHYIGILTMLDILAHIAGEDSDLSDLDRKMGSQVSSIIGHCLEGLSLWTLNPNTSFLECMEVFGKGIHRALVPVESSIESSNTIAGVELIESASAYRMLTQMDLLRFLRDHHFDDLKTVLSRSISDLKAVHDSVYAITERTTVSSAINVMKGALLNAVPIVHAPDVPQEDHLQLINVGFIGRHRKVIGTFSATDLKGCRLPELQTWLSLTALEFTEKATGKERDVVSCGVEATMEEAIEKVVNRGVHRVWVMDQQGLLQGVVSLTDIIRSLRSALL